MGKRVVGMSVIPGEPLDGSGRVCIHLFVPCDEGPFVEPHALHPVFDEYGMPMKQQVVAIPTRGRLACNSRRTVAPKVRGGVTLVTCRTDDPRGVTCPACINSADYKQSMETLVELHGGKREAR